MHLRFGGYIFPENLQEKYYQKQKFLNYILAGDTFEKQIIFVPQPAQAQKNKIFVLDKKILPLIINSFTFFLNVSPHFFLYETVYQQNMPFLYFFFQ